MNKREDNVKGSNLILQIKPKKKTSKLLVSDLILGLVYRISLLDLLVLKIYE